jgi:hypothetical protein
VDQGAQRHLGLFLRFLAGGGFIQDTRHRRRRGLAFLMILPGHGDVVEGVRAVLVLLLARVLAGQRGDGLPVVAHGEHAHGAAPHSQHETLPAVGIIRFAHRGRLLLTAGRFETGPYSAQAAA